MATPPVDEIADLLLRHSGYDFNDAALSLGIRWFSAVVQQALGTGS
jgi:hypothetical protein